MSVTSEQHQVFRRGQLRDRKAARQALPYGQRRTKLVTELALVSHTSSANPEFTAASADSGLLSTDEWLATMSKNEWQARMAIIEHEIAVLEDALDAHIFGRSADSHQSWETTESKNKRILEDFIGVKPETVTQLAPELGDALCIRKLRRENSLHTETGLRSVIGVDTPTKET